MNEHSYSLHHRESSTVVWAQLYFPKSSVSTSFTLNIISVGNILGVEYLTTWITTNYSAIFDES